MTREIKLTQGKVAIVDDEDFKMLSRFKWQFNNGYAVRGVWRERRMMAVKMHRVIMQPPADMQVDHINMNRLDNRRCNLRICTRSENKRNGCAYANNASGFKGVYWNKIDGKWTAQIRNNGKLHFLGFYATAVEGARAYNEAARELHGEFARLNLLDEKA